MKESYEGYKIKSKVWAASEMKDSEGNDSGHFGVFPATVVSVDFRYDKNTNANECTYWLETPAGEEWGDVVDSKFVSDDFDELIQVLKPIWESKANTF